MATQSESMAEGLKKLLSAISQLKVMPDADLQFLTQIEMAIIQKLHAGIKSAVGGGPGGPPGQPPMGPPQPNHMAPGGASGGGMGGLTTPPNSDELRRVLAGAGGGMGG